jgi:hypothetical protein
MKRLLKNKPFLIGIICWLIFITTKLLLIMYKWNFQADSFTVTVKIITIIVFVFIVLSFLSVFASIISIIMSSIQYYRKKKVVYLALNLALNLSYLWFVSNFLLTYLKAALTAT